MRRGTTPTHTFTVPLDLSNIVALQIAYKQQDKVLIVKQMAEVDTIISSANESTVILQLSQEETMRLMAERPVYIQMRVVFDSDIAMASNIIADNVDDCLDDNILPLL